MPNPILDRRYSLRIPDREFHQLQSCAQREPSGFGLGRWDLNVGIGWLLSLLVGLVAAHRSSAAPLSDPAVDSYNVRVGTETFSGLYKFTSNTLLVETAQAITNLGSDRSEEHTSELQSLRHL